MTVKSSRGSYDVEFTDVMSALNGLRSTDRIVVDENVVAHWPDLAPPDSQAYAVPSGEASKNMAQFAGVCSWLAGSGATRNQSRVFAVGGGVVGDLAGFAAASFARGVGLVMVPTTLLAMVDSSVGGKVAIDIPEGKNLVGAFWPPQKVVICLDFLQTLPHRELLCGSAEVWKYAFILDSDLLSTLESKPLGLDDRLQSIVERCVRLKAEIVEEDEFETTGRRAVLNFGHTIGHAVEAGAGYEGWTHGEAISVGMVYEARLGEALGTTPPGLAERVEGGLASQGLPTGLPEGLSVDSLLEYAKRDKKTGKVGMAFSLLTGVGECKLTSGVPEELVRRVLANK